MSLALSIDLYPLKDLCLGLVNRLISFGEFMSLASSIDLYHLEDLCFCKLLVLWRRLLWAE